MKFYQGKYYFQNRLFYQKILFWPFSAEWVFNVGAQLGADIERASALNGQNRISLNSLILINTTKTNWYTYLNHIDLRNNEMELCDMDEIVDSELVVNAIGNGED